jgi:hypothetical protein
VIRALVAILLIVASEAAVGNAVANGPVGGKPYEEQLNGANDKFLMELKRRVESSGFDQVEILPSMFVITAKNRTGQNVTLVVDSDTVQTLQIGADEQSQAAPCAVTPDVLHRMR